MEPLIWSALEYEHRERSNDWFWAVGVIALGGAILAIIFGNVLFGVLIIIGALTLVLYVLRHPRHVSFEINTRGVVVDGVLFPYQTLESFWIHEHRIPNKLIVKSQKVFMPYITLPLEGVPASDVRERLLDHISEEEVKESLSEHIMEILGF
ncbi:MAG: hypothetical protein AAB460_01425 [Patescibacteria group bacterium]